ncbi:MAG: LicD family protein [Phycisphaerales bacterium]|nr:LicD family protein [Phycisphaerales bacterium]
MSEVHQVLARMLALTVSRLESAGIDHCLIGGGCIGIVRHEGQMVPWDDDLDIAVWVDDIPRTVEALSNLPAPYGMYRDPPGQTPFCRVTDLSTRLIGPDGSRWPLGIFLDLIPMMTWASMRSFQVNDALQGFGPRDRVKFSQHPLKRLVKRTIYSCRLEGAIIAVREGLFCPWVIAGHARRRARGRGIVSGTIRTPWIGRYPWSTVFPTRPRELLGVRVQSPRDIEDFLVRRYGPEFRQPPAEANRMGHYAHAVRVDHPDE